MKKMLLLSITMILSVSLFGCNSNGVDSKMIIPNQLVLTQGDSISVNGESSRYSLHSLDFIDKNLGWVVRSDDNSNEHCSQILKTEDGGVSWKTLKLNNSNIQRLMFVNKTTGWAVGQADSKNTINEESSLIKILHTQDGGQEWDVQWEGKVNLSSGYHLWFQDTMNGYALISGTLLSTRDGGKQWSQVICGIKDFTPQHMSFVNVDTGWVVGKINWKDPSKSPDQNPKNKLVVLHTIDGGKHWRQQFAKDYAAGTVGSVDIDFVNATTGWFLTSDLGTWNDELYYTANAGKDWQKISQIRSARPSPTEVKFITPQVGWIPLDVGAGPISGGLMLTKDGGKDFTIVGNEDEMSSNREVDFISEQQGWVVATAPSQGDYLMHTGDGGQTWTQVYPKVRPTKDISFVDNQHGFGLGQLSDSGVLLYTADGGDTWKDIYNFSEKFRPRKLSFVNRNMGWVLGTSLNSEKTVILKTTDAGSSWTPLDVDITQQSPYFTSCFRFFDPNNGIIVADHFNVFRTQDGGRSWQVSTQELSIASFISLRQGWEILSSGSKPNTVGLSQMKDGATWQALGQISSNAWPIGIDFISSDKGFILLEEPAFQLDSRVKLLVTTNGGRTWSSHQFPQGLIIETLESAIPIQFTDDQHGWILSTQGLLRTRDGGKTWTWD